MPNRNVWLAAALINHPVRNSAGENLGKIEDLVIDPETATIRYAVVSFGGLIGLGDRLVAIPWSFFSASPLRDYLLLNIDKHRIPGAPAFNRDYWPDMADPVWQRSIDDYYCSTPGPAVRERAVYVETRRRGQGLSVLGTIFFACVLLGLIWVIFLIGTKGWEQARQDIQNSLQRVVYAAKETSYDAALTTKVKTALALSKRIPAGEISVNSQGGVVTLRGEVPSEEIRHSADMIARDVPGVRDVENRLYAAPH
jgi:sporulation protein YlmC with PRC-barrel domain